MKIPGFAKVCACGINTTNSNIPGFNNHPGSEAGNN